MNDIVAGGMLLGIARTILDGLESAEPDALDFGTLKSLTIMRVDEASSDEP